MRTLLTLLSLLLVATVAAAGATYRWVDTDGVHYSDQPHAGAEKIFIGQTQTYSSTPAQASEPPTSRRPRKASEVGEYRYDSCPVTQPAQDQVLVEVESVTIAVQVRPAKRSGDRVVLSFDGRPMEPQSPDQTEFHITPIERGTHTVAATVVDASSKNLCQSSAVTFHVRQPSVLAPLNPNRRH